MGSVGAYMTARELIDSELGASNIVRRAWAEDELTDPAQRVCWVHYDDGERPPCLIVCLVWSGPEKGYNTVKIVDELMGPGYHRVPDKIWDKRPPCPDSDWAREWREHVERWRAEFPERMSQLTDDDIGTFFGIDGYDNGTEYRYVGRRRHGRSDVPVFSGYRFPGWRQRRVRRVEE